MSAIKISSKVDAAAWEDLKVLAQERNQSVSSILTEAIQDYVRRYRIRSDVLRHLEDSMRDNEELGRLLAN